MTETNLINEEANSIKEFVDDHYAHFGAYPMEVETDQQVYTFDEYWSILDSHEQTFTKSFFDEEMMETD